MPKKIKKQNFGYVSIKSLRNRILGTRISGLRIAVSVILVIANLVFFVFIFYAASIDDTARTSLTDGFYLFNLARHSENLAENLDELDNSSAVRSLSWLSDHGLVAYVTRGREIVYSSGPDTSPENYILAEVRSEPVEAPGKPDGIAGSELFYRNETAVRHFRSFLGGQVYNLFIFDVSGIGIGNGFESYGEVFIASLCFLFADAVVIIFLLIDKSRFLTIVSREIVYPIETLGFRLNDIYNELYDVPVVYDVDNEIGDMYKKVDSIRKQLSEYQVERSRNVEVRKTMVSGLLHDIATPVTRISGCASMIKDKMVTDEESIVKYAAIIEENTEYIGSLLSKLSPAVKINENIIVEQSELVEIVPAVKRFVDVISPDLALNNTTCRVIDKCGGKSPLCNIDPRSAKRVANNIIYNSVKYKKPDTDCVIEITCSIVEGKKLLISVADNGLGIAPGTEEKLFDLCYRENSARTNIIDGTGVGLYICRETVKAFGGHIWAENNSDGLTINITLPIAR